MADKRVKGNGRGRSIFQTIMLPFFFLIIAESLFLSGAFALSGVVGRLNQNARDILNKQVENRSSYLENYMVGTYADLALLADTVNAAAQRMLESGELSLDQLDRSSDVCAPLLQAVVNDVISTLYTQKVSGVYLIFNTQDLSGIEPGTVLERTGLYIRDLDPTSPPSYRYADLLLKRAPIGIVNSLNISTDSDWHPLFKFSVDDDAYYHYLFDAFQAAYDAAGVENITDYGFWNSTSFDRGGSNQPSVSYSIPLILDDGTVYGVLGVDLLTNYLFTMLPYGELFDDKQGSYILAVEEEFGVFEPAMISGTIQQRLSPGARLYLEKSAEGSGLVELDGKSYYVDVDYLNLYNSNTPFAGQRWALLGVVSEQLLYAFSHTVLTLLYLAVFLTFLVGAFSIFIISRKLSQPIKSLSQEVERAQMESMEIPQLSITGVTEIDNFSSAITKLSREVVDASTKFLQIMDMASVELAGFEIRRDTGSLFVTDNFFSLFEKNVPVRGLTTERFIEVLKEMDAALSHEHKDNNSVLYTVPLPAGRVRYVRIEVSESGERTIGLAEDVTAATWERMRIEHERDYDLLTGLYNRRAFYQAADELFRHARDKLGHAALLMMDLDNLKGINDNFGHDCGDQYIRQAGLCFAGNVPEGTLCARVSGDEFYVFFHGYQNRQAIRMALEKLSEAIRSSIFVLPNGSTCHISASGGVAWYPEDSTNFNELTRFADFAMYQVKQSTKGTMGDFDLGVYNRESFIMQNRREFKQLLVKESLAYHFQPIVDANSGRVYAYEALMRVNLPTLRSPDMVLQLARMEGRLGDIERLTWFKASEAYEDLLKKGLVADDALLFINSIASHCMERETALAFHDRFGYLQPRMVIEITEAEDLNLEATREKRDNPGSSGMFALDDYGSGYNSEKNLLDLSPQFIKVDISIIRGIDNDTNKQKLVTNIVGYAHERGMLIIAEGVETAGELEMVLRLGVDLLQGYYLARPAAVPSPINSAAYELIRRSSQKNGQ